MLSLLILALPQFTPQQTELVQALIQVESSGKDDAVGDNGKAIGCLQIWKPYLACYKRGYAVRIFDAYMKRYAREAWTNPKKFDAEKVARIHNGGPKGYRKNATIKYWKKVQKVLD